MLLKDFPMSVVFRERFTFVDLRGGWGGGRSVEGVAR